MVVVVKQRAGEVLFRQRYEGPTQDQEMRKWDVSDDGVAEDPSEKAGKGDRAGLPRRSRSSRSSNLEGGRKKARSDG